ncbi:TonB-dependent siderophore receptor [Corticibacter populi]|uniref:TonB-dependent siderophore receptor n=1 Tax=Corticibacter populi TaxID=1550736 RepID=A0A3M6R0Y5_9BURK|nr:FepA family TonB-dependent siderophore receptor [Corticibacter populi]RMX08392.1 TonB-dependent siderophore receptor [Corticibacter populi]RZS35694.1 ferric enterobactin receptor [Corticibacter populi]
MPIPSVSHSHRRRLISVAVASCLSASAMSAMAQATDEVQQLNEVSVLGTAEDEVKQSLGSSVITSEDIDKRPPANDISELVRTQPGVNLTGNSSSGQYGNNRQIDLRGMGPENTLILIDGKPVLSREGVRMGRSGERDTRGDSNWVPAESIERIEVIRGPAAARYGSGAAGGVVNIITKKPGDKFTGSVTAYADFPQHGEEQDTRRLGFNLSGPVAKDLSFRVYGNVAKTSADEPGLNAAASGVDLTDSTVPPAGREGVRNRDINGLLRWDLTPEQVLEFEAGFSRQGNIYAGERPISASGNDMIAELANAGAETNSTIRRTASVTHRGRWGKNSSRTLLQYEGTDRRYAPTGLAGSGEGTINSTDKVKSELENTFFQSELNTPLALAGKNQVVTWGVEARHQSLDDPFAVTQSASSGGGVPGLGNDRDGSSSATSWALYLEDNIEMTNTLILTPGVRFDHHDDFGNNWSPSLNASWYLSDTISLKGGIARAFKAPNLYQSNPNYLYYTMGNGCPSNYPNQGGGCYIQGNDNLKAETSVNKEIGIAFNGATGLDASLTYFHNDYKNKIHADMFDQGSPASSGNSRIFRWSNAAKAVVQGFEGNLNVPLLGQHGDKLKLINNFTYMIENKNKTTDQPLSIIPKYTINSTLDWQIDPQWSAQLTATFYGKQEPRSLTQGGANATGDALNERGSYHLFGLATQYKLNKNLRANVGVKNLFDKRLFRESVSSGAGAATYNEPGRAYYLSLTASF